MHLTTMPYVMVDDTSESEHMSSWRKPRSHGTQLAYDGEQYVVKAIRQPSDVRGMLGTVGRHM